VGPACGVLFVVLVVAGLLLLDTPGHDDSDLAVNEFYRDASNRIRVVVAAYLLAGAALSYVLFSVHLWGRLKLAEGEPAILATFMLCSSVVFAAALFLTGTSQGPTYALYVDTFDEPLSEINRVLIPHQGYAALIFGLLASSASIASASLVILKTRVLASWLAWLGFVAAFMLLFGILFMPMVALPIWVLAASYTLVRAGREPSSPATSQ